ncbi:SRPBCC domain-containing protein [Noviherbaspirillum agri]
MFTHEVKTEIEINASAQRVWSVLIDFAEHPNWNPFIREITGLPHVGEKLRVAIQPPGGKGMTFRPTILVAQREQELRWLGRFLIPGLFDGEHYFRVIPLSPDKVRFIHGEQFSGLLVGLAKSSLDSGTKAGFEAMNKALKAKAESTQH